MLGPKIRSQPKNESRAAVARLLGNPAGGTCGSNLELASCEIDLRPGGAFNTTMRNPEGEEFPNQGCYLQVIPEEKLVFTDALTAGFRPNEKPFMTALILFEEVPGGTKYTAIALARTLAI